MRIFLTLALLLSALPAFALIPTTNFKFQFDNLQGQPLFRKYLLGSTLYESLVTMTCVYDYSVLGGAIGTVTLKQTDGVTACALPAKAVVRNGLVDVISTISPTSSYFSLGLMTAVDIQAATRGTNLTSGRYAVVPVGTAATAVKLGTANKNLVLKIESAKATAGKFRVFLDYVISQ